MKRYASSVEDNQFKTSWECQLNLVAHSDADDMMPVRAARVSYGREDKTGLDFEKDVKLMNFLAEHEHLTPFEYQHATFLVEVPLFIRSQIMRHRTFSYNEISRRYTSDDIAFWIPEYFRKQSTSNKQASTDEKVEPFLVDAPEDINAYEKQYGPLPLTDPLQLYKLGVQYAYMQYDRLIEGGVSREMARAVLPQSLLTRFYMGGNLRNWAHFIKLRRDPHAQKEVRVVAERIAAELERLWPESCKALGI